MEKAAVSAGFRASGLSLGGLMNAVAMSCTVSLGLNERKASDGRPEPPCSLLTCVTFIGAGTLGCRRLTGLRHWNERLVIDIANGKLAHCSAR